MATKRRSAHKNKKVAPVRRTRSVATKEKDPGYTVQVAEPSLLRRDLLETLREVILFMQSYEKFKRVQQDKVHLFSELKMDLKEISMLLNVKMKAHFPQGKLHAVTESDEHKEFEKDNKMVDEEDMRSPFIEKARQASAARANTFSAPARSEPKHELDALEDQLRDIESQLKNIQ